MGTEENRALIRRYYGELWNQWKFDLAEDLIAENIRFRGSLSMEVEGIEGFKGYMRVVRNAFPDFSNKIEEMVAEGDKVAARLTYSGTHEGELFAIAPTGRRVSYAGVAIFKVSGHRIIEGWVLGDTTGLLKQLRAEAEGKVEAGGRFTILEATDVEREWAASLMAGSEPWITLGRSLEQCRRACGSLDHLLFVARLENELCGFVLLHRRGVADSPYIKSIAVGEHFRSRGIGGRLIQFAEDLFKAEARHIFLCVSSFNERARKLYERLGYVAVGEFKDYVIPGVSEILMHKGLS